MLLGGKCVRKIVISGWNCSLSKPRYVESGFLENKSEPVSSTAKQNSKEKGWGGEMLSENECFSCLK